MDIVASWREELKSIRLTHKHLGIWRTRPLRFTEYVTIWDSWSIFRWQLRSFSYPELQDLNLVATTSSTIQSGNIWLMVPNSRYISDWLSYFNFICRRWQLLSLRGYLSPSTFSSYHLWEAMYWSFTYMQPSHQWWVTTWTLGNVVWMVRYIN